MSSHSTNPDENYIIFTWVESLHLEEHKSSNFNDIIIVLNL